ncbi:MAG: hypothetical protein AB7O88_19550 [Reyranellaceae bacterium]
MSRPDPRLLAVLDRLDLAARFAEAHGAGGSTEARLAAWSELAVRLLIDHAPEFRTPRTGGARKKAWLTDAEMQAVVRAGIKSREGPALIFMAPDKVAQAWLIRAARHFRNKPMMHLTEPTVARRELPLRFRSLTTPAALEQKLIRARKAVGQDIDRYLPLSTYRLLRKHSVAATD